MNDNKQCIEKDCSFYLNKYKVHFYRKTFIWTVNHQYSVRWGK